MEDGGDREGVGGVERTHHVETVVHGRYLVDAPHELEGPWPVLVGFHGYAERAEHMMRALRRMRGTRPWLLVSVEALNRFYTRKQEVVANWMTRDDRELAIADNIRYVRRVVAAVSTTYATLPTLVYAGFSPGVATAYRAAAFAAHDGADLPVARGAIMLAGDVPPDVAPHLSGFPPLLIGRGTEDHWYTSEKATADASLFIGAGITPELHVFSGGHDWDESFIAAAGRFLDRVG
jgi:predicted esterase